jgi:aromatic ring-opening dioxygenase catalytic subunit (LigB family)
LFDYYNFPAETYKYTYPAPSSSELVREIWSLLVEAGFAEPKIEKKRGYDHGIFVPLKLMYPEADIPVVAISLVAKNDKFDALYHFKLGLAIGKIREEGVLILGSGMTYHNLGKIRSGSNSVKEALAFDAFLQDALSNP